LFSAGITCRLALEQLQELQELQELLLELHQQERQVLERQQVLELALLLLFCHKRLRKLQRGLRVRVRAIFSFD
jgi:hypothetical protein